LTGVEIRLLSETEFPDEESIFYKPPAKLGTLRPEWPKPLPEGITPKVDEDGVAHYIFLRIIVWLMLKNSFPRI
jgi:hypothetical protein